jgi:gamma-glutamylcyclotransferase (GGCT)/AIG2-like uncharacterized protein YtfP
MYAFVYGTLKKGFPNHFLLQQAKATLVADHVVVSGYRLDNAGAFPVARPEAGSSIVGEIYEVSDQCVRELDHLESEGHMYNRVKDGNLFLYVGNDDFWGRYRASGMETCPKNSDGHYIWR